MKSTYQRSLITIHLCAFFLLSFLLSPSAFPQGSLTPPGAPAPTMKTLDQLDAKLEARTPISSAPFTISASGSYYLTGNLSVTIGDAITINADQVTLDLNGFAISSTASPASGTAVLLSGIRKNITVKNGHIRGTTTFATGVFTTGGFLDGVGGSTQVSANLRVSDLNILGMGSDGVNLGSLAVPTFVVERCNIKVCVTNGILATVIRDCTVETAGVRAISGDLVTNCYGESVGNNTGVGGIVVEHCRGFSASGTGVFGNVVNNSGGTSTSGIGLIANSRAINCEGVSFTGSFGLSSSGGTASFCRGRRDGGVALNAFNAIGCAVLGTGTVTATNKFLGTP